MLLLGFQCTGLTCCLFQLGLMETMLRSGLPSLVDLMTRGRLGHSRRRCLMALLRLTTVEFRFGPRRDPIREPSRALVFLEYWIVVKMGLASW